MSFTLDQINAGGKTSGLNAVASPFVSVFNDQQHFGYRDSSQLIWDAWYNPKNSSWNLQQINGGGSGRTGGSLAVAGPCIGVYQNQQHYVYVDLKGCIWDSWYDGNANHWNSQQINLGGRTAGPAAHLGFAGGDRGPVSIWNDPSNTQQHFTYLGQDLAIYDAFWNSNSKTWKLQKINAGGNTNGPLAGSSPFGCVFHNQQHIGYLDNVGNIHDSFYDGDGHWSLQKIGAQGLAPHQPFIWVDPTETQQHFTYLGPDSAVYDAFWDSNLSTWQAQKINAAGNTNGPLAKGLPTACIFGKEEHIGYLDKYGNVWDSWRDGNGHWNLQQVMIGPAAQDLVFLWSSNSGSSQLHFTYRDGSGVIWDSIFTPTTAGSPSKPGLGDTTSTIVTTQK